MRPNPAPFAGGEYEYNNGIVTKNGVRFVTIEGVADKRQDEVGQAIRDFCVIAPHLDLRVDGLEIGRTAQVFLEVDTDQITKHSNSETVVTVQIRDPKTGKIGRVSLELSIPGAGPREGVLGAKITAAAQPGQDQWKGNRRTTTINIPMYTETTNASHHGDKP